ncbi:MAG: TonB-dependent receptor [Gemmatimonadota bacterium]
MPRRFHILPALGRLAFIAGFSLLPMASVRAQSATGSTVAATVRLQSNDTVTADVELLDLRSGIRIMRTTTARGRSVFEGLTPGGPYHLVARAVGFHPATSPDFSLVLGQRFEITLLLEPAAVALREIVVSDSAGNIGSRAGGPAFVVSDSAVRRLPLLRRDFVELLQTAPEVSGTAIGSINNRYNNLLIDGGSDNDFFGLSRGSGAPGGQIGVRSLPLEAVREFEILLAPFDVRQGNFTGGQVDAVTRSGSNSVHASVFAYYQGQGLTGKDSTGVRAGNFSDWQDGASIGGPILRDRLHYFIAGELRHRNAPFSGPVIGSGAPVGISTDSAARFVSILQSYGVDPGAVGAFKTRDVNGNLFAKLSAATGDRGLVEGSLNYAHGEIQDTMAPPRAVGGDYRLTSAGFAPISNQWSGRLRWTAVLGRRTSNEFITAYMRVNEPRTPNTSYPGVFVGNVGDPGFGGARLVAGADPSSQQLQLIQRSVELTDNLSVELGRHTLTGGAHFELLHFDFASLASATGQYQFNDLASFAAGTPSRFIRGVALRPGGAEAVFGVNQAGVYVQDRWEPVEHVALTAGLRADFPIFPAHPVTNAALLASPFAVNTATFIKTRPLWSPRLGVRWDPRPGTTVRSGVGLFSGRLPYGWLSFAFTQTGNDAVTLTCAGAGAPVFNPNPATQPTSCVGGASPGAATITYMDPHFRMPQELKLAFGFDQLLPLGITFSGDGLYQHGYRQPYILDDNLIGPLGALTGEGGRVVYGSVAASSGKGAVAATLPAKVSTAFGPVLHYAYANSDRAYLLTLQVRRSFRRGVELAAAYSYEKAQDLMSLRDAQTVSNYGFVSVDGTLRSRNLATSVFSTPHKLTISGTVNLAAGFSTSLIYIGRSGLPFTYVVNGDANADGVGNRTGAFDRQLNDPIYIPRNAADISVVRDSVTSPTTSVLVADPSGYQRLAGFISKERCLRDASGALLHRDACRNPWQNMLNARVAKNFRWRGQTAEVSVDVVNVLHLINGSWGLIRETGSFAGAGTENVPALKLRGQDPTLGRNLYEVTLPATDVVNVEASRWRIQLGVRYAL